MRLSAFALLLGTAWFVSLPAGANSPTSPVRAELVPRAEVFVDEARVLAVDDVHALPAEQFARLRNNQVNLGFSMAAVWLRVALGQDAVERDDLIVVVPVAVIDRVAVYFPIRDALTRDHRTRKTGWRTMLGGDRSAFASRPVLHRHYVFPVPADLDPTRPMLVRVSSDAPLRFRVLLTDRLSLATREGDQLMARGLFYGLMVALFIYNLFLLFADRDRSRAYYLGWLVTAMSLTAVMDGLPAHVGWPVWWPAVANEVAVVLGHLLALSGVVFVRSYLQCRSIAPRIDQTLALLAVLIALATLAGLVAGGVIAQKLVYGTGAVTLIGVGVSVTTLALRRNRQGLLLLLTFCGLAPPLALLIARAAGLLETELLSEVIMHVGFGLEAVLISIALADRVNVLRRLRESAERDLEAGRAEFSRQLISTQENERRHFAKELHDSVGQNVLALKTQLDRWAKTARQEDASQIVAAQELATASIEAAREIAHQLHPGMLERLGLVAALHNLGDTLVRAGVHMDVELDPRLDQLNREVALTVYRIMQEGMANILKHAQATHCVLSGTLDDGGFVVKLSDNGVGFDATDAGCGLGLLSMRERARLVGATLSFESRASDGVSIRIRLAVNDS